MAIGNVIQRGFTVYVYDENNKQLYTKYGGSGPNEGLKGYTSSTVNIQKGHTIYTYDAKGKQISTRYAG